MRLRNSGSLLMSDSVCMHALMVVGVLRHWYEGFQRRHPELSPRMAQNISRARSTAQLNTHRIQSFFDKLRPFSKLPSQQLYAADETGLDGDGARRELVLAPTNSPRVFRQQDSYREHTSITHIGNAAGQSLPPVICLEGKFHDADIAEQITRWDERALYGMQENGYFTISHTLQLLRHIDQHAVKKRPLLLILDGASGHIDLDTAQYAVAHRIDILVLPSNCTHFLQVADVSVFGPFKHYWRLECQRLKLERAISASSSDVSIRREDIVPLAASAWKHAVTPRNVISGFRRTGIYPFNPQAHRRSLQQHAASESLSGLPLLQSPAAVLLAESAALSALTPAVTDPPQAPRSAGVRRKVRRTLNTAAGALITAATVVQDWQQLEAAKRAAAEEKEEARRKRAVRKAEIVEEKAALAQRRAAKEAAKAVKAATAAAAAASAAHAQRVRTDSAAGDKENSDPNLPAGDADVALKYTVAAVLKRPTGAVLRLRAIR